MSKKALAKIMAGALDALAYAKGDKSHGVTHVVRVPDSVDVAKIRRRMKLSQARFAARFGLDVRALQDWEQKRRKPDRATRVLLAVIANEPEAVDRALT